MFIKAPCATCMNENPPVLTNCDGEVADSGLTFVDCPLGHQSAVIWDERKHMVLMTSAVQAMADGHYREAVSSIAAALERCYEFYIRAALYKLGLSKSTIDASWKSLAKQSERQLGAFAALYAAETHTPFQPPPSKMTEFRNNVTHKGVIPSSEEVVKFGRQVYDLIQKISADMNVVGDDATRAVQQEALDLQRSQIPDKLDYVTARIFGVRITDEEAGKAELIDTFDELCRLILKSDDHKWGDMSKRAPSA